MMNQRESSSILESKKRKYEDLKVVYDRLAREMSEAKKEYEDALLQVQQSPTLQSISNHTLNHIPNQIEGWQQIVNDTSIWQHFYQSYIEYQTPHLRIKSQLVPGLNAYKKVNEHELQSLIRFAIKHSFHLGGKYTQNLIQLTSIDVEDIQFTLETKDLDREQYVRFRIQWNTLYMSMYHAPMEITGVNQTTFHIRIVRRTTWNEIENGKMLKQFVTHTEHNRLPSTGHVGQNVLRNIGLCHALLDCF